MSTQLRNLNVEGLEVDLQAGVCKLTLNKPEKLNAIDMGVRFILYSFLFKISLFHDLFIFFIFV